MKGKNANVICSSSNDRLTSYRVRRHAGLVAVADYMLLQNDIPIDSASKAIDFAVAHGGTQVVGNPAPAPGISLDAYGDLSHIERFTPN